VVATNVTSGHEISIHDHDALLEVRLDGHTLASSRRAKVLLETGLPPRYYIPRDDVQAELTPSDTRTSCPFKGDASYWSAKAGDGVVPDIAWSYEHPIPQAEPIAGHVAFFNERVDVVVDGAVQDRPSTPWS
jgi:uncharacterized protein (DUF427 family)